ncbi:MAG: hypothetical protein KJO26_11230, partial [Deltaproteobacteria bacterium]|nr:hypothetical protein [Deltaproteobacteria bacterium]
CSSCLDQEVISYKTSILDTNLHAISKACREKIWDFYHTLLEMSSFHSFDQTYYFPESQW